MKTIWQPSPLDRGFPQIAQIKAAGCTRIAYAALYPTWNGSDWDWHENASQLTPAYRDATVKAIGSVEIFRDPHWGAGILDPLELARLAHEDIVRITGGNSSLQCSYCLDIEWHDADYVLAALREFRRLRPGRQLTWTLEPKQGGWFSDALVRWINASRMVFVCPQTFLGDMAPVDPEQVRRDVIAAGVKPEKVVLFYDAAHPRPAGWNGELFHAERLVPVFAALGVGYATNPLDAWRRARYQELALSA